MLMEYNEHPQAWTRVDTILQYAQSAEAKIIALNVLARLIQQKWTILPEDQREGMKNFVVDLIVELSSDQDALDRNRLYVKRLNLVLVNILKHEWPGKWPDFIPELVNSSSKSESLCENNMMILMTLSEEVFDYSKEAMVSSKVQMLKERLNSEFSMIFDLCVYVLENATSLSLISATLSTLHKFLNWIPLGYIFETSIVSVLLNTFFPNAAFRNMALLCLVEIGSLSVEADMYDDAFVQLYMVFVGEQLSQIITRETNIIQAHLLGSDDEKSFVHYLALFFTEFFKAHRGLLESREDTHEALLEGHMILAQISAVRDQKIFRITLDYWHSLARSLYIGMGKAAASSSSSSSKSKKGKNSKALVLLAKNNPFSVLATSEDAVASAQRKLYKPVLSAMRLLIIQRMPKPEEVLVVEDENGHIVRHRGKDTAAMALYKVMRDTLVFLTNLDPQEVEVIMKSKLVLQMNGREWSWANISTLCWAIGSISGAYSVEQEKRFLVHVIKDLLALCEMRRGKDNKAVVAANIMYVVGQYPRFLLAHWKFLKTVVTKLFEFMHERHEGVQDMACDTFLKIAYRCRRKFVTVQPQESEPFIIPILRQIREITEHLEPSQIQTFFAAIGCMIADTSDAGARDELSSRLFEWPNGIWAQIMSSAADDPSVLDDWDTMRTLADLLRTNVAAADSMGNAYLTQLSGIYLDILSVYNYYSEAMSTVLSELGAEGTNRTKVKLMRAVKKEALVLIATYVKSTGDGKLVIDSFVPPLMEAVLYDYRNIIPAARDAEVLSLMETMAVSLKELFTPVVPHVLDAVFQVTLEMITEGYDAFMDIRVGFFRMLRAFNEHCFGAFFMVPEDVFKYTVEAMVWAMEHNSLEIAELGVRSLLELLDRVNGSEVADAFYESFFLNIMTAVFSVLTDTLHKTGFRLQVQLLQLMLSLVATDSISSPVFDTAAFPGETNMSFTRSYVTDLLAKAFSNVKAEEVAEYVDEMFRLSQGESSAFKSHMRDFLISIRQYTASIEQEALQASLAGGSEGPGALDLGGGSMDNESMALAPPSRAMVMHDVNNGAMVAGALDFGELNMGMGGGRDAVPMSDSMALVMMDAGEGGGDDGNSAGALTMEMDEYFVDDRRLAVREHNKQVEDMYAEIPGMLGPHHPRTVENEMQMVSYEPTEDDLLDPEDVPTTHELALSGALNGPNSFTDSAAAHSSVLALASEELQAQLAQPAAEAGALEFGNSDTGAAGSSALVLHGTANDDDGGALVLMGGEEDDM